MSTTRRRAAPRSGTAGPKTGGKGKKSWRRIMWEAVSKYDVDAVEEILTSKKVCRELQQEQVRVMIFLRRRY